MGGVLNKVAPGEPFSMRADTYNAFVDAAVAHRGKGTGAESGLRTLNSRNEIILIKNDVGYDLEQFNVIGIDGIVIGPQDNDLEFKSRVVLRGESPSIPYHLGRFAITAEPIKNGEIGHAFADGIVQVKIYVEAVIDEPPFAEIEDLQTDCLDAAFYGSAKILWREGGAGEQWAVVRLGRLPSVFPVRLERVSGDQGDDSNPATWSYDLIDPYTGVRYRLDEDPTDYPHEWKRPEVGFMHEANFGYAHFNHEGELSLGWINEVLGQEPC